jgi:tetratricopeptide (TPR) repeat protein/TolB-like protein
MLIGTRLGPYEIVAPLGAGGMGEVFKARDTRLGRAIAIKVLPAGLAADPDRRRRFEQEARAVAALSHPHICVLHDIGSQDGVDFLVMEYLEGQTLAARLRSAQDARGFGAVPPIPLKEALEIGAQVADALGAAHRHGIVHRDLKPANIMLTPTGGVRHGSPQAKLLDFGLAKLRPEVSEAAGGASAVTTEAPLTGDRQLLGTVPYMAPEQLEGKPADARSDVFALGCVLYEMLTGRRAFEGASSATVIAAILTSEPPPVSTLQPATPPLLDRLVQTCLAKRPDDRWDSAHDVAEQLRAISETSGQSGPIVAPRPARWTRRRAILAGAAALLLIVAASVGGFLWAGRAPAPAKPPTADITPAAPKLDPNRVVVALFENRTGDPTLDTVAVMTTDMLTRGLSQSGELAVSQNPAVATGGGPAEKPSSGPTAADALRTLAVQTEAGLVIAGAIYREGDTLRFESRLIDGTTGALVATLDPVTSPRAAPSPGIERLGQQVIGHVASFTRRDLQPNVMHVPPYEAYRAWQRSQETYGSDYDATIRELKRALALDPEWVSLRAWIVLTHNNQLMCREAESEVALAEQQLEKLAPFERLLLRNAHAMLRGNYDEVLETGREMDRLAPGLPWLRYNIGYAALVANRPRLAAETLGTLAAQRGAPTVNAWAVFFLADAQHLLGQYAAELETARKGRQQFPTMVGFHGKEARALVALGRLGEAERPVDEALAVSYASRTSTGGELASPGQVDPGEVMCLLAMEMGADGHSQAAVAMARRAAAWFEARPASSRKAPSSRWVLALAKFLAEDWDGARVLYEPLANLTRPERPSGWSEPAAFSLAVRFRGRLGVIAARRGDRTGAERIAEELRQVDRPYLYGESLYSRAMIAASLGDKAAAVQLLREAIAQGLGLGVEWEGYAVLLHRAPEMAPLRGYPPFEELIKPKG